MFLLIFRLIVLFCLFLFCFGFSMLLYFINFTCHFPNVLCYHIIIIILNTFINVLQLFLCDLVCYFVYGRK